MNLSEAYLQRFYEGGFQSPVDIHQWLQNSGNPTGQIQPALMDLANTLVRQGRPVETIWCLMACKDLTTKNADLARYDDMVSSMFQKCYQIGKEWLTSEIDSSASRDGLPYFLERFETNLKTLVLHHPVLCARLLAAPGDRKIAIIPDQAQTQARPDAYTIQILDHPVRQLDTSTLEYANVGQYCQGGIVFLGMGICRQIHHLKKESRNTFGVPNYKIGLFVLEPHFTIFKANLFINNLDPLLTSDRVYFFIGKSETDRFLSIYQSEPQLSPSYIVYTDPVVANAYNGPLRSISEKILEKTRRLQNELQAYYEARSTTQWHDIFNNARPLRVMGFTCLFTSYLQYCMRDWLDGFRENGCDIEMVKEKEPVFRSSNLSRIEKMIEFKPDIILCISYNRSNFENLEIPPSIPYVNWQQDRLPHCLEPETIANLKARDLIVTTSNWTRQWLLETGYPSGNIHPHRYWPANTNIYKPVHLSPHEKEKYQSDIFYVSHNSSTPEAEFLKLRDELSGGDITIRTVLTQLFDLVSERFREWDNWPALESDYEKLLDQVLVKAGIGLPPEGKKLIATKYFYKIGERFIRHLPLEKLAGEDVRIALYGNNWESHPKLGKYARGVAQNGAELNLIYNAAKMTFNAMAHKTSHNRVMDAAAAKCFFLIQRLEKDEHPITLAFQDGVDFMFYDDPDDFVKKVMYFLDNPEERQKMVESAYARVQDCTYQSYARSIANIIKTNI